MTSAIAKQEDRFSETAIDDEIVVMSLDSGDFYSLVGTARDVWRLIDGARGADAIVAELASEYGVAPSAIADEVEAFLADLRGAGLVAG